jgi:hypothetical protein
MNPFSGTAHLKISPKKLLILASFLVLVVVVIYISNSIGIEFADTRVRTLCRLGVFILPCISICIFLIFGPMWLKIIGALIALPQSLIMIFGLLLIPSDLGTLFTGYDSNMVLLSRKLIDSKYLCQYYVGMEGGATVGVREVFRYETPIFPGIIKINVVDVVYPDKDEYYSIMDGITRREKKLDFHREDKDPQTLLSDGLKSYFQLSYKKDIRVEYELLSSFPLQVGIDFPKLYVWAKIYINNHLKEQGVVKLVAINKTRLAVSEFLDEDTIIENPELVRRMFPKELCQTIFAKSGIESLPK